MTKGKPKPVEEKTTKECLDEIDGILNRVNINSYLKSYFAEEKNKDNKTSVRG